MSESVKNKVIAGGVVALLLVVWISFGRFAVEGGKAPWAVINDRNEVLKAALTSGVSSSQKQDALWRAVFKDNEEAVRLLLAAGADPNKVKIGDNCVLEYPTTGLATIKALIEGGADATPCRSGKEGFAASIVHRFGRSLPEPEVIAFLQLAAQKGMPADGSALASAEKHKLEKLTAYLRNPSGKADFGKAEKLALRGGDSEVESAALKAVCKGDGVAALPPYKKETNSISPAYLFHVRSDDELRNDYDKLPAWWIADKLQHTQVVACARIVSKRLAKDCKYEGGAVVSYYDATYDLSVREAKTANQLASKTVALDAKPPASARCFRWGAASRSTPNTKTR